MGSPLFLHPEEDIVYVVSLENDNWNIIIVMIDTLDGNIIRTVAIDDPRYTYEFECKEISSLNLFCVRCIYNHYIAEFFKIDL